MDQSEKYIYEKHLQTDDEPPKFSIGYSYGKSITDSQGEQYFNFNIEPDKLDELNLWNDVKGMVFSNNYKKETCTVYCFIWIHGVPENWKKLKVFKNETIDETEIPRILEELGITIE